MALPESVIRGTRRRRKRRSSLTDPMRHIAAEEFSTLVGAIYDCALDPAPWPGVLTTLCRSMDFRMSSLILANILEGDRTADRFVGNAGDDKLSGLRGADDLAGGFGADRFVDLATADSTSDKRDAIRDFGTGADVIDLKAIDADRDAAGNHAFDFIGSDGFGGTAGELRVGGSGSLVLADTDGDRTADLVVRLADAPGVTADVVIL
jgi:Ca2+-binding RTX toxin-like protein